MMFVLGNHNNYLRMKRLLLPLLAALALPNAVNANVDPEVHNLCKDVSDYMGCVKANSKKEGLNLFKKDNNKILNLTEEQKIKWCDYGDYNDRYMKQVNNCIANLESLGPKAINNLSIEIHERCASAKFSDTYLRCLSNLGQDINIFNTVESALIKKEREERNKRRADNPEVFTHKGKTYTASRIFPEGENMYWQYNWRKAWEIGCMTLKEKEAYSRYLGEKKRDIQRQQWKETVKDLEYVINPSRPSTIYCNSYDTGYGFSTTCNQN